MVAPAYPSGSQYQESLQNTATCFNDPDLHGSTPVLNTLGLPRPISGNYAVVFTVTDRVGRRWGVKCFTRNVQDQARRYQLISNHLSRLGGSWRVRFDYVPDGVRVQGRTYPILKMEWIEAKGLLSFIEAELWNPAALARLASRFSAIVSELRQSGVAHGDLQHGNILVTAAGEVKLVDYDGMFVPGLEPLGATERGHANYQSPARVNQWGPDLDRFSAWTIYVSLVALTFDPTLWLALRPDGAEALLFTNKDFANANTSQGLRALQTSGDPRLQQLASVVHRLWSCDFHAVPAFSPTDLPAPATEVRVGSSTPSANGGAGGGLPAWMRSSSASPSPGRSGAGTPAGFPPIPGPPPPIPPVPVAPALSGQSWLGTHLPIPPSQNFASGLLGARLVFVLTIAAAIGVALIVPVGLIAVLPVFIALQALLYHQTPERAKVAPRRAAHAARQAERDAAKKKLDDLLQARQAHDAGEAEERRRIEADQASARRSEDEELRAIAMDARRRTDEIVQRRQASHGEEASELAAALKRLQDQHIERELSRHVVGPSSGIGDKLVSNLRAAGIHTAADFTGVSTGTTYSGRYSNQVAYVVRRHGGPIRVPLIGPAKGAKLDVWRQSLERRSRASQPTVLPGDLARAIAIRYNGLRQTLTNEERTVQPQAQQRHNAVKEKWRQTQVSLAERLIAVHLRSSAERTRIDAAIVSAYGAVSDAERRLAFATRDLEAMAGIRFVSYLRHVVTFR